MVRTEGSGQGGSWSPGERRANQKGKGPTGGRFSRQNTFGSGALKQTKQIESLVGELQAKVDELKSNRSVTEKELEELRGNIDMGKSSLGELQEVSGEIEQFVAKVTKREMIAIKGEIEQLLDSIESLTLLNSEKKQVIKLRAQYHSAGDDVDTLRDIAKTLSNIIAKASARKDYTSEKEELRDTIDTELSKLEIDDNLTEGEQQKLIGLRERYDNPYTDLDILRKLKQDVLKFIGEIDLREIEEDEVSVAIDTELSKVEQNKRLTDEEQQKLENLRERYNSTNTLDALRTLEADVLQFVQEIPWSFSPSSKVRRPDSPEIGRRDGS